MKKISCVLLAALVSVPFLIPYHAYPLLTFETELAAFLIAFALIWCVALSKSSAWPVFPVPAILLFMGAWLLLTTPHETYWQRPALAAGYLITAGAVLWATRMLWMSAEPVERWVMGGLAVGGFLMAITGFVEHWQLGWIITAGDQGGMIGALAQRNLFSAYLACGLAGLLALRPGWAVAFLVATPVAVAMAYSGSRAAWALLPAAGVALLGGAVLGARPARPAVASFLAAVAIFTGLRLLAVPDLAEAVGGVGLNPVAPRWQLAQDALRIWWDHPFMGAGWGEFAHQMLQHAQPGDLRMIDRHAHNILAQVAAETGLLGLLAVLHIGGWIWWRTGRALLDRKIDPMVAGAAAVLAILTAFSFTEFPLWHAEFLFLFVVASAMIPSPNRTCPSWLARPALLTVAAVGALCATVLTLQYQQYSDFWHGRVESVNFRTFWRPQLEHHIAGFLLQQPATLRQEKVLVGRALHYFPTQLVACNYVWTLAGLREETGPLLSKVEALYGPGACAR